MEYQIVNEISSFWENLVIPIILGIVTIVFILWNIGKDNRKSLIDNFLNKDNNNYILYNGIYIKKNQTRVALLKEKISQVTGISEMKPVLLIFFVILLMFGFHQIILMIFPPSMYVFIPNMLFASGLEDSYIACLWRLIPEAKDLSQLCRYISENSEYQQNSLLLISIEAYLKFFISIIIIKIFFNIFNILRNRRKRINCKIKHIFVIPIICILLVFTYFAQIQSYNNATRERCYEVYYKLDDGVEVIVSEENIEISSYLEKIKQEKMYYEDEFYYNAYHLRVRGYILCKSIIYEIVRYFN